WCLLDPFHRFGERVPESLDDLEQRQIRVADACADEPAAAILVPREEALEPAQEFRQAFGAEARRSAGGFALLVAVVEAARDRMVRAMHLLDQIRGGGVDLGVA